MIQNEYNIVAKLKAGDKKPLDDIYIAYREPLMRTATRKFSSLSSEKIEDCVLTAIKNFYANVIKGSFEKRNNASIKSYLTALVNNRCLNIIAKRKVRQRHEPHLVYLLDQKSLDGQEILENKEQLAMQAELIAILLESMEELPENYRQLLSLRYWKKMKLKDIATFSNYLNESSVKMAHKPALKKLRQIMLVKCKSKNININKITI
ncbi:MAG: RNA polymerase sigma factor [Chitinophagales bacterium]